GDDGRGDSGDEPGKGIPKEGSSIRRLVGPKGIGAQDDTSGRKNRWQGSRAGRRLAPGGMGRHGSAFFSFFSLFSFFSPTPFLFREGCGWRRLKRKGKPSSQAGRCPPARATRWYPGPPAGRAGALGWQLAR